MSDETKPSRPEPKLQPMRIVNVPETNTPSEPSVVPGLTNDKGKKLVLGKKEYEMKKANKAKQKPNIKQSNYHMPLKSDQQIQEANNKVIDDLDRNAKLNRAQEDFAPEYDTSWLTTMGGTQVTVAWLQTAISVAGFISSETTLSNASQKIRGLTMTWVNDSLWCSINNSNGKKLLIIPAANVKCMSVE